MADFTILSLCSGVGTIDLGVKLACRNARTVCYVEREVYAAEILAERMAEGCLDEAPVWTDMRTFAGEPWRGAVDCVIAGIPCQGNSLAGRRLLEDDTRNLWPDARRILRDVGSEWFFLENVPGFLIPDGANGRTAPIVRVLADLADDGWAAEWDLFSAAQVGAPHIRERLFLLAKRTNPVANGRGFSRNAEHHGATANAQPERETRHDALRLCHAASVATSRPKRQRRRVKQQSTREAGWGLLWSHAESGVQRVADDVPDRVDRLRAIGGAVVPLVAATAFSVLYRRLTQS